MQKILSFASLILPFSPTASSAGNLTEAQWEDLNKSLPSKVVRVRPPAAPCYNSSYDAAACAIVLKNWTDSNWRAAQIGAMQYLNFEQRDGKWCDIGPLNDPNVSVPLNGSCEQGNVPSFGVEAHSAQDVSAVVTVANRFRIPLVVKGTGHDYLSRSSAPDRLLIWMHTLGNASVSNQTVCGKTYPFALTAEGGSHWGTAYDALGAVNRVVPGGADPDVGASGGQVQGGGHSALSNTYGLTPDSVIQFEVVTMDGKIRLANACQNTDLFWALRGGGGGTYGIVTRTFYQSYDDSPVVVAIINATVPLTANESFAAALDVISASAPTLAEQGWSGYIYGLPTSIQGAVLIPLVNGLTADQVNATLMSAWAPLYNISGLSVLPQSTVFTAPSFRYLQSNFLASQSTGSNAVIGSRLIPKTMLQNDTSRALFVKTMTPLRQNDTTLIFHMVAGSNATSNAPPGSGAVLPAWRKAIFHVVPAIGPAFPIGSSENVIQSYYDRMTRDFVEPLRQITPGGGAYMNEADSQAPNWKEDFFGVNYDKLSAIKRKYDPHGLLKCNRCVEG